MTHKIKFLALLLAIVMVLGVFAACNDTTADGTDSESESENVTETGSETETATETNGETDSSETATESAETETRETETQSNTTETESQETESTSDTETEGDTGWETMEDLSLEEAECEEKTGHRFVTNWAPAIGTASEKKYCYYCGKETNEREAPIKVFVINAEQSANQTAIRANKANAAVDLNTVNNAKIVIPTTPEFNIVISDIGVAMTGNCEDVILGNAVYYSVDNGETWTLCPGESEVLTIALVSEMFTGENEGNVAKAKENGIWYGVIPGYNAEYIAANPGDLAKVMRKFASIDAELLSDNVEDAAGHKNDATVAVKLCDHQGSREAVPTVDGEYTTYTYKCSVCNAELGTSGKIKDSVSFFDPAFLTDATLVGVQNGVVFTRLQAKGKLNAVVSPVDGYIKLGRYIVIKYRAIGDGSLKLTWSYDGASKDVKHNIARAETDGWIIAVMDLQRVYSDGSYLDGKYGGFTLTFECEGIVDVAYIAMASEVLDLCAIMDEGDVYYNRGANFTNVGAASDSATGRCIVHNTKVSTKSGVDSTIYSYTCDACDEKLAEDLTVPKTIPYYTNVNKIVVQTAGDGTTAVNYLCEDGVVFARLTCTGTTAANVLLPQGTYTMGKYLAIKYRVSGEGYLRLRPYFNNKANDFGGSSEHDRDVWTVAIIDISDLAGYASKSAIFFNIQYTCTVDIAYVAISDDLGALRSLLGENEHYFARGGGVTAFNNFGGQAEVTKNGECVGAHKPVTIPAVPSTCVKDGHTEGSACLGCGEVYVATQVIPSDPGNHVVEEIPAVSATCVKEGATAGSKCSECGEVFVESVTIPVNPNKHIAGMTTDKSVDGVITYKFKCSNCGLDAREPITVPSTLAYIPGPSISAGNGNISKFSSVVEDGIAYRYFVSKTAVSHATPGYSEAKIEGITWGRYVAVKYRVSGTENDGSVRFELRFDDTTLVGGQSLIENAQTDGWVVAVIDIGEYESYNGWIKNGKEGHRLWFRVVNGATVDISYVVMSDDMGVIRSFLEEGEHYFFRGNKFGQNMPGGEYDKNGNCVHQGGTATCQAAAKCANCGETYGEIGTHTPIDIPAVPGTCGSVGYTAGSKCQWCGETYIVPEATEIDPNNHQIIMTTTQNEGGVTYAYGCRCGEHKYNEATLVDGVGFVDITKATTSNGTVQTLVDEQGRVYIRASSNGGETTTTIVANGIKLGMTEIMKYRINGGNTPDNSIAVSMVYTLGGVDYALPYMQNKVVSAADLAIRHAGWVVGRINNATPFNTGGYNITNRIGEVVDLTITITHTDDFELYYFITDKNQDNKGTFEYVVSMGDNFYLHQNQVFGSYIKDQWREITDKVAGTASGNGHADSLLVNTWDPTKKK